MRQMLGSLFFGYKGVLRCITRCDTEGCNARSNFKGFVYFTFPRWMLDITLSMKLQSQGPELLIRCLRHRQYQVTPAFQLFALGHYDQVKGLLLTGQASVLDIEENGFSLLHVIRILNCCSLVSHELMIFVLVCNKIVCSPPWQSTSGPTCTPYRVPPARKC